MFTVYLPFLLRYTPGQPLLLSWRPFLSSNHSIQAPSTIWSLSRTSFLLFSFRQPQLLLLPLFRSEALTSTSFPQSQRHFQITEPALVVLPAAQIAVSCPYRFPVKSSFLGIINVHLAISGAFGHKISLHQVVQKCIRLRFTKILNLYNYIVIKIK